MRRAALMAALGACGSQPPAAAPASPAAPPPDAAPAPTPEDAAPPDAAAPRGALDGCDPGVPASALREVPADDGAELDERARVALGRAAKDDEVRLYEAREAKIVARGYDAWLRAGAPMTVHRSFAARLDTDDRDDRVVVVTFDVEPYGTRRVVAATLAASPAWRVLTMPGDDPAMRVVALADVDGDGWQDVLFVHHTPTRRLLWRVTARPKPGDERFRYILGATDCE